MSLIQSFASHVADDIMNRIDLLFEIRSMASQHRNNFLAITLVEAIDNMAEFENIIDCITESMKDNYDAVMSILGKDLCDKITNQYSK